MSQNSECVRTVAALLGSSREAVCGRSKHPATVRARRACFVALHHRGLSLHKVAAELGGKDHSTVHHGLRRSHVLDADDNAFAHAVATGVAVGTNRKPTETPAADTSDPREAIVGILSTPGRVPDSTVRAIWVLLAALAGVPVESAAAC